MSNNCDHCGATGRRRSIIGCSICTNATGKNFILFKKRKKDGKREYPMFCDPCKKKLWKKHDEDSHTQVNFV